MQKIMKVQRYLKLNVTYPVLTYFSYLNAKWTPNTKCPFKATCEIENNSFDFFGAKSGSYSGNKKLMSLLPSTHIARVV